MRLSVKLSKSKLKAYLNSRPSEVGDVALLELVALAESHPPGFYNTVKLLEMGVEPSKLEECLNDLPDDDKTIEFSLSAKYYVPPLKNREILHSNLAYFLQQLTFRPRGDRRQFNEIARQNKKVAEEEGISALLGLLTHSVATDPDYDEFTRGMLLAFLDDQLPAKLMVKLPRGPMPMVPELAIRNVLEEWLAGGGGMESAYARAKEELGVGRTIAQRVAKKYNLRPATKTE